VLVRFIRSFVSEESKKIREEIDDQKKLVESLNSFDSTGEQDLGSKLLANNETRCERVGQFVKDPICPSSKHMGPLSVFHS
jgi:hypothetical protein